jgi:hypothetical protein
VLAFLECDRLHCRRSHENYLHLLSLPGRPEASTKTIRRIESGDHCNGGKPMEEENDRSAPMSIDEIVAEQKTKPVKPKGVMGFPIAVGNSGFSLRKGYHPHYNRDDDDDSIPDGAIVGARIK